jgi:uncharacterized protein YndB with AHSA1/START domain
MINLNISMLIDKPIAQIFDFISTPENDFQWQYGTLSSNRLSQEFVNIGAFFRSIGHLMGRRSISTFQVTEFEENKKYGFKSLSGPLNSHTTYTFEVDNHGTKVNVSTQVNAINLIEIKESTLEKKMKRQLNENFALLKQVLEANEYEPV